jgi:ADP-heptose:LPS heptosyltransferase
VRGLRSIVLWGPDEQPLAQSVVDASSGAAILAPPTQIADLVELSRAADLIVSGDTGPVHIAAAVGTPIVAIYGPTDPARNGPWAAEDVVLSRFEDCDCHYLRQCRRIQTAARGADAADRWCLESIGVAEVTAAIQQRLASRSVTARPGDGLRDRATGDV